MNPSAPFGYKKDGTPRTRRAPGTGSRYQKAKPSMLVPPVPPPPLPLPSVFCPVTGCNLNFDSTKDPKNSLLVHVRYKSGKGNSEHQQELEKMKKARKTDRNYIQPQP